MLRAARRSTEVLLPRGRVRPSIEFSHTTASIHSMEAKSAIIHNCVWVRRGASICDVNHRIRRRIRTAGPEPDLIVGSDWGTQPALFGVPPVHSVVSYLLRFPSVRHRPLGHLYVFRINELRTARNSVAQNRPSSLTRARSSLGFSGLRSDRKCTSQALCQTSRSRRITCDDLTELASQHVLRADLLPASVDHGGPPYRRQIFFTGRKVNTYGRPEPRQSTRRNARRSDRSCGVSARRNRLS
jgi:hypothetical protein